MNLTKQNAIKIIDSLSPKKMKVAFDYLSYLKDKEEWEATQELLDFNILREIKTGVEQIQKGQYVHLKEVRRNV
jgi:hypothetical protein